MVGEPRTLVLMEDELAETSRKEKMLDPEKNQMLIAES